MDTVYNKAVVTQRPNWPQIFSGEWITLRCEMEDGGDTEWEYEQLTTTLEEPPKHSEYWSFTATFYSGGNYRSTENILNW